MPTTTSTTKPQHPSEQPWIVKLRLTRKQFHQIEDVAHFARRAGCKFRSGPSEIIRGLLSAVLPVMTGLDFSSLAQATKGQSQVETRVTVERWIKKAVARRLRRR